VILLGLKKPIAIGFAILWRLKTPIAIDPIDPLWGENADRDWPP
jgi:hypothetical protein